VRSLAEQGSIWQLTFTGVIVCRVDSGEMLTITNNPSRDDHPDESAFSCCRPKTRWQADGGRKMKGKNIGDIFLPTMFLPQENRGGIHYSEHISVPLETMWIVVRTFLIGANVATPPHV
jgi:hypothetical protein